MQQVLLVGPFFFVTKKIKILKFEKNLIGVLAKMAQQLKTALNTHRVYTSHKTTNKTRYNYKRLKTKAASDSVIQYFSIIQLFKTHQWNSS